MESRKALNDTNFNLLLKFNAIESELNHLKVEFISVKQELADTKLELAKYKIKKNSQNSSIAPSKDENRIKKNQSLREQSTKKIGGQVGHKGSTLEMISIPTHIEVLQVGTCSNCGLDIRNVASSNTEKRQVVDIAPIQPTIVIEYQSISKICSCGKCNKAVFPLGVNAPIQYGPKLESLIAYLSVRQYMPFKRIKEYLSTTTELNLSQGTIQNILSRMASKALPFYNLIKENISQSPYVGGDESSMRVNGSKNWFWTIQNDNYTLIHCSDNRGFATLEEIYPQGLPNTVIGHDAYALWFKFKGKDHQLCLAHLQRDLNYFKELHPNESWITDLKTLFHQAIDWKKNINNGIHSFKEQLKKLLENPPNKQLSALFTFYKRILKYKDHLLTFLDYDFVPADNNGSERAIRVAKVKTKISGQFKSIDNAQIFAILRSIIDSLIKQNKNILENLFLVALAIPE